MLNFNKLEKILNELEKQSLFNQFIARLLNYSLVELNKMIIRYKIDDCFIIDIFDYKDDNKFIRYYFTDNNNFIESYSDNVIVKVVNLNNYYENFNNINNNYSIFSSLFYEKDINILKSNLSKLFDEKIIFIIIKYISDQTLK